MVPPLRHRIKVILFNLDCFLFSLFCLGKTEMGESASEAAWKVELKGGFFWFWRPVIDAIFFFDENHCRGAYENAVERARIKSLSQFGSTNSQKDRDVATNPNCQ